MKVFTKFYGRVMTFLLFVLYSNGVQAQFSMSNYAFSHSTNGSLEDLSSGATILLTGVQDDVATSVIPIGFDFYFMGNKYTHLSANSNGNARLHTSGSASAISSTFITSLSANTVTFAVMSADNECGDGIRYKVIGTAPNRKFVLEWKGFYIHYTDITNAGNMQLWLSETTGRIDYVYGELYNTSTSSKATHIFASSGNTAGSSAVVTVGNPATVNRTATSSTSNTIAAGTTTSGIGSPLVANLGSSAQGSRIYYTFIPPSAASTDPTTMSFTSVGASTMIVNWVDNSADEAIFLVTRATDASFTQNVITATINSTTRAGTGTSYTSTQTGLSPSTIYYFKIQALNEGTAPSTGLTGTQSTAATTTYTWVATSGSASWATAASWSPARNTPDATDILQFNGGGSSTATSIPTQTVGRITVSNNTTINLQAASTATLTIASDGTATDELNIESGSTLMSNGTAAALTITYSGTGSTGTIAGTMEATSATGSTTANTFTFTGGTSSVTTVTGTLAAGQSGGTGVPVITGSAATLTIASGGTYQHKFTTSNGTIPTATWNAASNCSITGYTAASMTPSGLTQTFGNFTWNCTGQGTNNYNFSLSGTTTIAGTLTISSTGTTGSVRLTGTGGYTFNVNNFTQTGGIFDLQSGASGTPNFNVSGTFNQSGGTFQSSATGTGNPTLNFNGTSNQAVTFTTQPTGPITYRVNNNAGITLTGPSANFSLGNGTLGGLRISTTSATPITFGGSTTAFSYNAANSTLTYDATTGNTTARDTEFPSSNGPASLRVAIGSGNVLTVPFNRTIRTTLTMTSGDIDISTNTLELGTSASASATGTLTWTAGSIRMTTGSLTRWYGTSGLPTSAGTAIGYYPIANGANNRNVSVYFSSATALNTSGGSITVSHNGVGGLTTVSPALTETQTIDRRTNASWTFAQSGLAGTGTIGFRLTAGNLVTSSTPANLRVILSTPALAGGANATGSGTAPSILVARSGLSIADLANTFSIGAASADIASIYNSIATGNWSDGTKWDVGSTPSSSDMVNITNGTNISLDGANAAATLTVNAGGTLTAASNSLAITNTITNSGTITVSGGAITVTGASTTGITNNVGSTFNLSSGTVTLGPNGGSNRAFTNNGTLTVSGGTLNINGSFTHTASTGNIFTQSGGNINVDGNAAGVSANSVSGNIVTFSTAMTAATGVFSGGTFTIVDPHASSTLAYALSGGANTAVNCSTNHTFRFGDGVSTDPGTTSGFYVYLFPGSSYLVLGNVVANGGSGVNRFVSTTSNVGILGDLTINANSEYRISSTTYVAGNIVNNGLLTTTSTLSLASYSNATVAVATNAQTISGSGVFRNAVPVATIAGGGTGYVAGDIVTLSGGTFTTSAQFRVATVSAGAIATLQSINYPVYSVAPTYNANLTGGSGSGATVSAVTNILNTTAANMANLTVNNSNATGVTLNVPLSISGTFTLTSGLVNTTMTNLLQVGTATTNASLSFTHNATTMITGPFARTFIANRSTSGASSIALPLGKNGIPMRLDLDANTAATGPVIMVGEAFNSNNGIAGAGVSNLSTKTWSVLALSGSANLTNIYVKATDAGVTATSKLLHSATIDGTYNGTPGGSTSTGVGGTVTSSAPITAADYLGYFAYGDLQACTAPTDRASNFVASLITTSSFTANFDAAASGATGYLVVRTASGVAATTPADGTLYTAGATALGGTIVGNYYTAPFTFNQTSLTPAGTTFDYAIFSFNNSGCAGPTYFAGALTSSVTTCATATVAPGTPTSSNITSSSFSASWTASSTVGVTYEIDVSTNSSFTTYLAGYQALNIGSVLTYSITGLSPTTTYFVRVRAVNGSCYSSNTSTLTVSTLGIPTITNFSSTVPCGSSTILTINGTNLSSATLTVGGVAITPLATNTSTQIVATISSAVSGIINVVTAGGTVSSVTPMSFLVAPSIAPTANFARCANDAASAITVSSSNDPNYTYIWSPSTGLSATTGASITANPSATTTYTVTATDASGGANNGCVITGTVAVTVNANPTAPTVTPASTTMCSNGAAVQLTASGSAVNGTATIGTGTSVSAPTATNNTYMPNVYGNYYGGTKVQSLILASELTAATLIAGSSISSIAFEVGTAGSNTLNSFKVKVGHSSLTALSGNFQTGLTEVYSGTISSQATGFGTVITFSTPFVWDGTSNLIVETSYSNNDGGNTSTTQTMKVTTTAFASTQSYRVDSNTPSAVEAATAPTYTESERPNIRFAYTNPVNYTWTSITGLYTDAGATSAYASTASASVYAKPSSTTTYTATATNAAGCTATNTATVTVNQTPTTATAGTAQTNTTGTFTLAGNTPTVGTGAWSVVSGTANITDPASATSAVTVTGTPSTSAALRWTISNGTCTPSTADVTLNYLADVTAGAITCTATATLNSTNSGQWLYAQHAGGIVVGLLDNQNLGTVSVEYKVDGSPTTRTANGTQFVDRDFAINSTNAPTSNVTLRLYFLNSELAEIGTALANAKVTRVPGVSCSGTPNFTGSVFATVTGTGAHGATSSYIEISVPSFSAFYIQQDALTPLPIELKSFSAAAQGAANRVNWVTVTEQNVSHFVVERSEDGRSNWTAIAQTKAVGNSQIDQKYQIFDNNPTNLAYYRLRSVDNNGKTQLSNIVSVVRQTSKLTLVTAAPVPFADNLMIDFAANRNANVTITILDLMGRVVHTEQIDAQEGVNRANLNLSKLANGAYILNINDGEYKDNRRIIKQQ